MTQQLPLCAHCGKPLAKKARVLFEFCDLTGNPTIGWHPPCAKEDEPLFIQAVSELTEPSAPIGDLPNPVVIVFKRQSKRVSVRKWTGRVENLFDKVLCGPY